MTQEALKLALDALENHTAIKHPQQIHYRDKAITAIKEALAQEQEPVALPCCGYADASAIKWNPYNQVVHCHNCGQIYTIPLQPEQEPVAWMFQHDETGRMNYVSNDGIHNPTMFLEINPRYALVCPLYAHPPQRTWVGLTDEEIDSCFEDHGWSPSEDYYPVIKDIEAKLKQKNGYAEEKNT